MTNPTEPDFAIGAYGPAVIWNGDVGPELLRRLEATGARELRLIAPIPGALGSLDALAEVPLVGLSITPCRPLGKTDWPALARLPLRYLMHQGNKVSGHFDLDELPQLEWLSTPWWKGLRGLGGSKLDGLGLRRFRPDEAGLADLPASLRCLSLSAGPTTDLRGVDHLEKLEYLGLGLMRSLQSLAGIEHSGALRECSLREIHNLTDVSALASCPKLERLQIEDCKRLPRIDLAAARSLEGLWLTGNLSGLTTAPDWIASHPALRRVVLTEDVPGDRNAWSRDDTDPAYGPPPGYDYRPPNIVLHSVLLGFRFARRHLYPAWLRERHPELCPD